MQRALRKGREGAHLLDLVAPELHAKRLAPSRREDVDEPAADRELSTLVRALHSLVAGERERLGELLEAHLLARRDPDRPGTGSTRRHRLSESRSRGHHKAAGLQHVQCAGTLADEMRRRIEPGAPAHPAARQHRDALLAEEPGGTLGRVACVLVLRREENERTSELLVQRSEE